jgi:hypothetical protein
MLIKEICVKWFIWVLKKILKTFNFVNWELVSIKDFWTLTPKYQFYKALGKKLFS